MTDAEAFLEPTDERVPRGRPPGGVRDDSVQRHHLLRGLVASMAELGYYESTVTDISSRAKVSRRTFYENFDSKEGAFLIAYQAANAMVSATVEEAVRISGSWPERLLSGVRTYITVMVEHPEASLVFLRESWRAGRPAWDLRHRILREWAGLLQNEFTRARAEDPLLHSVCAELDEATALGVVHAFEGLVLDGLESSGSIDAMVNPCIALVAGAAQVTTQAFTHILIKSGGTAEVAEFVARVARGRINSAGD